VDPSSEGMVRHSSVLMEEYYTVNVRFVNAAGDPLITCSTYAVEFSTA